MASGFRQAVQGAFMSDGAARVVDTPGFRPAKVEVWTDAGVNGVWLDSMPDAAAFKRLANGTGSYITSNGVTPDASGFTLGADAALNATGQMVFWSASE